MDEESCCTTERGGHIVSIDLAKRMGWEALNKGGVEE